MVSNSEKLEILFELYEQKMYKTAFSILRNHGQAEDAVQDAFMKVITYLDKIENPQTAETVALMVRIIRSTAIDIYRKNQKDFKHILWNSDEAVLNHKGSEERALYHVENRELIKEILAHLDSKYREVLELKFFWGLSYYEISKIIGVSENTVAKRYERAKQVISKMIGDETYE